MSRASKKKRARKERVATNERVIREFFERTEARERGLLAALWYFGEEPEMMRPGEKECYEGLVCDIGARQFELPPMETVRILNLFEEAGVFTSYRPEGSLDRIFRFTQKGAAFGWLMQQAAEKDEARRVAQEKTDDAERASVLATASRESPDAAAELSERLILMENLIAEHTVPKPADLAFAAAIDEMATAGTYPADADLVRKARAVLASVRKLVEENTRKEAEHASNG